MSKPIVYFPHDTNSRNDARLQRLFMKEGVAGIGIYWCIIEMLHENTGKIDIKDIDRIAFELRVDNERITNVLKNYELFDMDEVEFWSDRVNRNITDIMDKSSKARESVKARWNKRKNTTVILSKEIKEEEKKEEVITPPAPSRGEIVYLPELEIQIAEYKEKNRLKYTDELYTQFLEYWGAPVISGRGIGKKLWQVQKAWSLSGRLATWNSKSNTQTKKNGTETAAEEAKRLIREGNR